MEQIDNDRTQGSVGYRLRELREERRISMRELARLSGLSVNALSQIERGLTSPSVSTLYKLVGALQIPITAIFRNEPLREDIVFRSGNQRTKINFPSGIMEGLGGEDFVGKVQPFLLTLDVGADSGSQPIIHTGHEFVFCVKGMIEYRIEGQKYFMEAGDSLLFAARLRHCWRNPGETDASAIIVLSGFEEYENPIDIHVASE